MTAEEQKKAFEDLGQKMYDVQQRGIKGKRYFVFKIVDFALQMMNFVLKMMAFSFKMMTF